MAATEPPLERTRRGDYRLRLSREEREVLRALPSQLRELLGTEDPSLRRLYPPAYEHDPEHQAEYERLVREELSRERIRNLEVMERTVDASRLSEEQVAAWLGALNDLRLVLGTRLDVSEDFSEEDVSATDPRGPALTLYGYLGWLEAQVVDALAEGLPEA